MTPISVPLVSQENFGSSVTIFGHSTSQWPNFFGYKEVWVGYENKIPLTKTPSTHAYSYIPSPTFAVPTWLNQKCSKLWWRKLQAEKRAKQHRNKSAVNYDGESTTSLKGSQKQEHNIETTRKQRKKKEPNSFYLIEKVAGGGEGRRWWRQGE